MLQLMHSISGETVDYFTVSGEVECKMLDMQRKKVPKCIICRKEKNDLTDEHVIPDALGGYYHIHTVCKDCNSKLGSYVDTKLIHHLFSIFQRYSLGLKGKNGQIPNPFDGTHSLKDNEEQKVRLEKGDDGIFVPYLIMSPPQVIKENEKTIITIKMDSRDKKQLPSILKKIAKRNNLSIDQIHIDNDLDQYTRSFRPEISMNLLVDLNEFKIGLLKIAYEFAIDSIPEYYNDETAISISKDLENCKIETNDLFIGSGFEKNMFDEFRFMLDIGSKKHYLVLCPTKEFGLVCMIYLSNMFSIVVKLSQKEYLFEDCIFGINDIENKKFEKLTIQELHNRVYAPAKLRFMHSFSNEQELYEFQKLKQSGEFEFYKDAKNNQPIYDKNGVLLYEDINDKLESLSDNEISTQFNSYGIINEVSFENEELYIKINPNQKLLRVVRVRSERCCISPI